MSFEIKDIPLQTIWQIRREVMYPQQTLEAMQLPDDAGGLHLGLFDKEQLCSVISLFIRGGDMQFRKFATLPHLQGKGYGSALLAHIFALAKEKGLERVWCNARITATQLYRRFGMLPYGDPWEAQGHRFIKMQVQL